MILIKNQLKIHKYLKTKFLDQRELQNNSHKKAHFIKVSLVRIEGVEPTHLTALDPKSSVSTNSTISAGKPHEHFFTHAVAKI